MTNSSKMILVSSEEAAKLASCFFDYMLHGKRLLSVLKSFKKKEGRGTEYMNIFFRNDFEEWDEDRCSEGNVALMFEPPGTREIGYLTLAEFYTYIEVASKKYLEKFPSDVKKINYLLTEIQFAFGLMQKPLDYHADDSILRRKRLNQDDLLENLSSYLTEICTTSKIHALESFRYKIRFGFVESTASLYFRRTFDKDDEDICQDDQVALIVKYPNSSDEGIGYISMAQFYELLIAACKEHNTRFPHESESVDKLLQEIKVAFNLE